MLLPLEQLIGLPVETKSGRALGKLEGLVFQTEGQSIYQYQVKPAGLSHLFDQRLLIHQSQIIAITKEKIVADDAAYQETDLVAEAKKNAAAAVAPAGPVTQEQ